MQQSRKRLEESAAMSLGKSLKSAVGALLNAFGISKPEDVAPHAASAAAGENSSSADKDRPRQQEPEQS